MGRWDNNKTGLYGKWYDFVQQWGYGNNYNFTSSLIFLGLGIILILLVVLEHNDMFDRPDSLILFAKIGIIFSFIMCIISYWKYKRGIINNGVEEK